MRKSIALFWLIGNIATLAAAVLGRVGIMYWFGQLVYPEKYLILAPALVIVLMAVIGYRKLNHVSDDRQRLILYAVNASTFLYNFGVLRYWLANKTVQMIDFSYIPTLKLSMITLVLSIVLGLVVAGFTFPNFEEQNKDGDTPANVEAKKHEASE